eukprot:4071537-Lingulodinium_polyedra.AAC.1
MPEFALWANAVPNGIDIIEICGGEGRPSQVCPRRQFKVGPNFDLRCGFDLLKPRTPFGPWARLSRVMNPRAWQ